jgi:uncharacterized paraquat-inducible protein A
MTSHAVEHLKKAWGVFRHAKPGARFEQLHAREQHKTRPWMRPLLVIGTVVSLVLGVIFAFIPGPAVVFFAIAAALLAMQSEWIARHLDEAEQWSRRKVRALRAK